MRLTLIGGEFGCGLGETRKEVKEMGYTKGEWKKEGNSIKVFGKAESK